MFRLRLGERLRAARPTPQPDRMPYGLVFDIDSGVGIVIRPAARPAAAIDARWPQSETDCRLRDT